MDHTLRLTTQHSGLFMPDGRLIADVTGQAHPASNPYAATAHLPTVAAHILYEQGRLSEMQTAGYPRFFHSMLFRGLRNTFNDSSSDVFRTPMLNKAAAEKCIEFVGTGHHEKRNGVHLAVVPKGLDNDVKAFMQHSGLLMSARQAEDLHQDLSELDGTAARAEIKRMIAASNGMPGKEDDITLYPTGMAAVYQALQLANKNGAHGKTVQYGFAYLDSMLVQEKCGPGGRTRNNNLLVRTPEDLEKALEENDDIVAVFFEIPSNPLLRTAPLRRMRDILDDYERHTGKKIILVGDDTVATSENVDIKQYVDITVTSLSKSFTGKADVMGGALTLTGRDREIYEHLKEALQHSPFTDLLYGRDAIVIAEQGRDWSTRVEKANTNALEMVEIARKHGVKDVWHPSTIDRGEFEQYMKGPDRFGSLFSLQFANPWQARRAFDRVEMVKCPGLGFEFSAACMINILTNFSHEDRQKIYAEGMSMFLTRYSAGTEDDAPARFEDSIEYALAA